MVSIVVTMSPQLWTHFNGVANARPLLQNCSIQGNCRGKGKPTASKLLYAGQLFRWPSAHSSEITLFAWQHWECCFKIAECLLIGGAPVMIVEMMASPQLSNDLTGVATAWLQLQNWSMHGNFGGCKMPTASKLLDTKLLLRQRQTHSFKIAQCSATVVIEPTVVTTWLAWQLQDHCFEIAQCRVNVGEMAIVNQHGNFKATALTFLNAWQFGGKGKPTALKSPNAGWWLRWLIPQLWNLLIGMVMAKLLFKNYLMYGDCLGNGGDTTAKLSNAGQMLV